MEPLDENQPIPGGDETETGAGTPEMESADESWEETGPTGGGRGDQAARARESAQRWIGQLQAMIDNVGRDAGPVLRDVAAKAAELAAVAAENAGPVAHKAAEVTDKVGARVAQRSKEIAADLRRQAGGDSNGGTDSGAGDSGAAI